MRVGVVADTHCPPASLPIHLLRKLSVVDLIIHAGDLVTLDVLRQLQALAPLEAVWGNNDDDEVRAHLRERLDLRLNGHRVEVVHGHQGRTAVQTARRMARSIEGEAVLIFGHSHQAFTERVGGAQLLNPGSPTQSRFSRRKTYATLAIEEDVSIHIEDVLE